MADDLPSSTKVASAKADPPNLSVELPDPDTQPTPLVSPEEVDRKPEVNEADNDNDMNISKLLPVNGEDDEGSDNPVALVADWFGQNCEPCGDISETKSVDSDTGKSADLGLNPIAGWLGDKKKDVVAEEGVPSEADAIEPSKANSEASSAEPTQDGTLDKLCLTDEAPKEPLQAPEQAPSKARGWFLGRRKEPDGNDEPVVNDAKPAPSESNEKKGWFSRIRRQNSNAEPDEQAVDDEETRKIHEEDLPSESPNVDIEEAESGPTKELSVLEGGEKCVGIETTTEEVSCVEMGTPHEVSVEQTPSNEKSEGNDEQPISSIENHESASLKNDESSSVKKKDESSSMGYATTLSDPVTEEEIRSSYSEEVEPASSIETVDNFTRVVVIPPIPSEETVELGVEIQDHVKEDRADEEDCPNEEADCIDALVNIGDPVVPNVCDGASMEQQNKVPAVELEEKIPESDKEVNEALQVDTPENPDLGAEADGGSKLVVNRNVEVGFDDEAHPGVRGNPSADFYEQESSDSQEQQMNEEASNSKACEQEESQSQESIERSLVCIGNDGVHEDSVLENYGVDSDSKGETVTGRSLIFATESEIVREPEFSALESPRVGEKEPAQAAQDANEEHVKVLDRGAQDESLQLVVETSQASQDDREIEVSSPILNETILGSDNEPSHSCATAIAILDLSNNDTDSRKHLQETTDDNDNSQSGCDGHSKPSSHKSSNASTSNNQSLDSPVHTNATALESATQEADDTHDVAKLRSNEDEAGHSGHAATQFGEEATFGVEHLAFSETSEDECVEKSEPGDADADADGIVSQDTTEAGPTSDTEASDSNVLEEDQGDLSVEDSSLSLENSVHGKDADGSKGSASEEIDLVDQQQNTQASENISEHDRDSESSHKENDDADGGLESALQGSSSVVLNHEEKAGCDNSNIEPTMKTDRDASVSYCNDDAEVQQPDSECASSSRVETQSPSADESLLSDDSSSAVDVFTGTDCMDESSSSSSEDDCRGVQESGQDVSPRRVIRPIIESIPTGDDTVLSESLHPDAAIKINTPTSVSEDYEKEVRESDLSPRRVIRSVIERTPTGDDTVLSETFGVDSDQAFSDTDPDKEQTQRRKRRGTRDSILQRHPTGDEAALAEMLFSATDNAEGTSQELSQDDVEVSVPARSRRRGVQRQPTGDESALAEMLFSAVDDVEDAANSVEGSVDSQKCEDVRERGSRRNPRRGVLKRHPTGDETALAEMLFSTADEEDADLRKEQDKPKQNVSRRNPRRGVLQRQPTGDETSLADMLVASSDATTTALSNEGEKEVMSVDETRTRHRTRRSVLQRNPTGDEATLAEMMFPAASNDSERIDTESSSPESHDSPRRRQRILERKPTGDENSFPDGFASATATDSESNDRTGSASDESNEASNARRPRRGVRRQPTGDSESFASLVPTGSVAPESVAMPGKRRGRRRNADQTSGENNKDEFGGQENLIAVSTEEVHTESGDSERQPRTRRGVRRQPTGDADAFSSLIPPGGVVPHSEPSGGKRRGRRRKVELSSSEEAASQSDTLLSRGEEAPPNESPSEGDPETPRTRRGLRRQATGDEESFACMLPPGVEAPRSEPTRPKRRGRRSSIATENPRLEFSEASCSDSGKDQGDEHDEKLPLRSRRGLRRQPTGDEESFAAMLPHGTVPHHTSPGRRRGGRRRSCVELRSSSSGDSEPKKPLRTRRGVARHPTGDDAEMIALATALFSGSDTEGTQRDHNVSPEVPVTEAVHQEQLECETEGNPQSPASPMEIQGEPSDSVQQSSQDAVALDTGTTTVDCQDSREDHKATKIHDQDFPEEQVSTGDVNISETPGKGNASDSMDEVDQDLEAAAVVSKAKSNEAALAQQEDKDGVLTGNEAEKATDAVVVGTKESDNENLGSALDCCEAEMKRQDESEAAFSDTRVDLVAASNEMENGGLGPSSEASQVRIETEDDPQLPASPMEIQGEPSDSVQQSSQDAVTLDTGTTTVDCQDSREDHKATKIHDQDFPEEQVSTGDVNISETPGKGNASDSMDEVDQDLEAAAVVSKAKSNEAALAQQEDKDGVLTGNEAEKATDAVVVGTKESDNENVGSALDCCEAEVKLQDESEAAFSDTRVDLVAASNEMENGGLGPSSEASQVRIETEDDPQLPASPMEIQGEPSDSVQQSSQDAVALDTGATTVDCQDSREDHKATKIHDQDFPEEQVSTGDVNISETLGNGNASDSIDEVDQDLEAAAKLAQEDEDGVSTGNEAEKATDAVVVVAEESKNKTVGNSLDCEADMELQGESEHEDVAILDPSVDPVVASNEMENGGLGSSSEASQVRVETEGPRVSETVVDITEGPIDKEVKADVLDSSTNTGPNDDTKDNVAAVHDAIDVQPTKTDGVSEDSRSTSFASQDSGNSAETDGEDSPSSSKFTHVPRVEDETKYEESEATHVVVDDVAMETPAEDVDTVDPCTGFAALPETNDVTCDTETKGHTEDTVVPEDKSSKCFDPREESTNTETLPKSFNSTEGPDTQVVVLVDKPRETEKGPAVEYQEKAADEIVEAMSVNETAQDATTEPVFNEAKQDSSNCIVSLDLPDAPGSADQGHDLQNEVGRGGQVATEATDYCVQEAADYSVQDCSSDIKVFAPTDNNKAMTDEGTRESQPVTELQSTQVSSPRPPVESPEVVASDAVTLRIEASDDSIEVSENSLSNNGVAFEKELDNAATSGEVEAHDIVVAESTDTDVVVCGVPPQTSEPLSTGDQAAEDTHMQQEIRKSESESRIESVAEFVKSTASLVKVSDKAPPATNDTGGELREPIRESQSNSVPRKTTSKPTEEQLDSEATGEKSAAESKESVKPVENFKGPTGNPVHVSDRLTTAAFRIAANMSSPVTETKTVSDDTQEIAIKPANHGKPKKLAIPSVFGALTTSRRLSFRSRKISKERSTANEEPEQGKSIKTSTLKHGQESASPQPDKTEEQPHNEATVGNVPRTESASKKTKLAIPSVFASVQDTEQTGCHEAEPPVVTQKLRKLKIPSAFGGSATASSNELLKGSTRKGETEDVGENSKTTGSPSALPVKSDNTKHNVSAPELTKQATEKEMTKTFSSTSKSKKLAIPPVFGKKLHVTEKEPNEAAVPSTPAPKPETKTPKPRKGKLAIPAVFGKLSPGSLKKNKTAVVVEKEPTLSKPLEKEPAPSKPLGSLTFKKKMVAENEPKLSKPLEPFKKKLSIPATFGNAPTQSIPPKPSRAIVAEPIPDSPANRSNTTAPVPVAAPPSLPATTKLEPPSQEAPKRRPRRGKLVIPAAFGGK